MENNKITIRARCKICGHAATNFLPWPVTDNLVTCPVCGKHFDADAKAPHQAVMSALEAARDANLSNIVFSSQVNSQAKK